MRIENYIDKSLRVSIGSGGGRRGGAGSSEEVDNEPGGICAETLAICNDDELFVSREDFCATLQVILGKEP